MSKKIVWEHRNVDTQLVDCQVCKGKGTVGEGVFKKQCPNPECKGTGKVRI